MSDGGTGGGAPVPVPTDASADVVAAPLQPDGGPSADAHLPPDTDSGPEPGCDFNGRWASFIRVPVSWPASLFVLLGGEGELVQWNLSSRRSTGPGSFEEETVPCGIFLPDLQGELFAGFEKFGIRFPESLFDHGGIPATVFTANVTVEADGRSRYRTSTFATLIGHRMANPTTAAWPTSSTAFMAEDHDGDSQVGVTVRAVSGGGYGYPPVEIPLFANPARAELIYLATRTVSTLEGSTVDCDTITGSVTIETVAGTPGINSRILGCRRSDGLQCTADEAMFVDANRPQFTPSGAGVVHSTRVSDSATCADVRALYPL